MIEIDHNPHEKRPTNTIWWVAWIGVAFAWIGQLYSRGWSSFDWTQISLGAFSMGVLATWAIDITGNKAPDWLYPRAKKRKRYLPDPTPGEPMTGRNGKALLLVVPAFIALTVALIWLT